MNIYGIGGLGADKRVFQKLSIFNNIIFLDWLTSTPNESIEEYAQKMSLAIPAHESYILIGVSFGGLIPTEINKIRPAHKTILISSIETSSELPLLYRLIGKTHLIPLLPTILFEKTKGFALYSFGARDKVLLRKIIADTDPKFLKWALQVLVCWSNRETSENVIRIHGDIDRLLPGDLSKVEHIVCGGKHFMIVDRADEVSECIYKIIA